MTARAPWAVGCAVAALLVSLTASAPAHADPENRSEARRLYTSAWQHMERGDYARALVHYEASLKLARHARTLFNIATCEDKLGRTGAAIDHYRAFLTLAETRDAELVSYARARVVALGGTTDTPKPPEPRAVMIVRSPRAGARVTVDGADVGTTTPATGVAGGAELRAPISAGVHRVVVHHAGSSYARSVSVGARERITVDVRFSPVDSPARRAGRWALFGVGTAGVVGGVVLGGMAIRDVRTDSADRHATGKRRAMIANVALATGVVSLVSAWLLRPDSPDGEEL